MPPADEPEEDELSELLLLWAFRAAIRLCMKAPMALCAAQSVDEVLLELSLEEVPEVEVEAVDEDVPDVLSVPLLAPTLRPRLARAWLTPCIRPPPGGGPGGGPMPGPLLCWLWLF